MTSERTVMTGNDDDGRRDRKLFVARRRLERPEAAEKVRVVASWRRFPAPSPETA